MWLIQKQSQQDAQDFQLITFVGKWAQVVVDLHAGILGYITWVVVLHAICNEQDNQGLVSQSHSVGITYGMLGGALG